VPRRRGPHAGVGSPSIEQRRPLEPQERAVIERLLSVDFRDIEYFRAQVPALTVIDVCSCGSGSLGFEVDWFD
jgi:hypothetical protein